MHKLTSLLVIILLSTLNAQADENTSEGAEPSLPVRVELLDSCIQGVFDSYIDLNTRLIANHLAPSALSRKDLTAAEKKSLFERIFGQKNEQATQLMAVAADGPLSRNEKKLLTGYMLNAKTQANLEARIEQLQNTCSETILGNLRKFFKEEVEPMAEGIVVDEHQLQRFSVPDSHMLLATMESDFAETVETALNVEVQSFVNLSSLQAAQDRAMKKLAVIIGVAGKTHINHKHFFIDTNANPLVTNPEYRSDEDVDKSSAQAGLHYVSMAMVRYATSRNQYFTSRLFATGGFPKDLPLPLPAPQTVDDDDGFRPKRSFWGIFNFLGL